MSTASIPLTTGTRSPRPPAPAGAGLRGALPHPRRLIEFGPHEGAHRVALRAGIAMAVPLGLLLAAGRLDLSLYAVFGAFTVLYGRSHSHVPRLRMQATAAVALVAAVVAGTAIGTLPGREWIVVPAVAVVAVGMTFLSEAFAWHPPGSLFFVFALAACASVPSTAAAIPLALVLASASAAFGMLVSVVGLARPAARRVAPTSWRVSFAAATARLGSGLGRRMLLVGIAVLVAGIVPTVSGLGHPYWAMVAAVAALGAADTAGHLLRAGHRMLGTVLGVALAALLLAVAGGAPVPLVALVVLLQMAAELFVLRNYGLTVVFVTPLALIMAQLAHPVDEWGMLRDRTLETLLGAAVAVAVSLAAAALLARRRLRRLAAPSPAASTPAAPSTRAATSTAPSTLAAPSTAAPTPAAPPTTAPTPAAPSTAAPTPAAQCTRAATSTAASTRASTSTRAPTPAATSTAAQFTTA